MRALALAVVLPLLANGCSWTWDKVDFCDTGGCDECATDDDCVVGYSCCGETLYCMHQAEELVTCQLACPVPREPACRCVQGRCSFE